MPVGEYAGIFDHNAEILGVGIEVVDGIGEDDVPDYALMAGVPARQIGWVNEKGEKVLDCPSRKQQC